VIGQVRDRLWTYLSPASDPTTLGLTAAALLQMDEADILSLARLHFLLSPEVGLFLASLPGLIRRLPTTTAHEEEWSAVRVRGAIDWPLTYSARAATGLPHMYVTRPTERAYQTPEAELVVFLLEAIQLLSHRTGWADFAGEGAGSTISSRAADAARWLQNRPFVGVIRRTPTVRSLARLRSGRHHRRLEPSIAAYSRYRSLIAELDRAELRSIIESGGLVTRQDSTLFELLCTFRVLDALGRIGWELPPFRLFEGSLYVLGSRRGEKLDVWYQTAPRELRRGSEYVSSLQVHGFTSPQDLRPDLVLRLRSPRPRWLLVECKLRKSGVDAAARAGLVDLLAYRRAFSLALDMSPEPVGLGIAWGEQLVAADEGAILLATPDSLKSALQRFAG
jgi:hypothetical protein